MLILSPVRRGAYVRPQTHLYEKCDLFFPLGKFSFEVLICQMAKHPFYQIWAISVNLRVPLPNTHLYTHSFPFSGLSISKYREISWDVAWSSVMVSMAFTETTSSHLVSDGQTVVITVMTPRPKRTQLLLLPSQRAPPTLPWPCVSEGKFRSSQPHGLFFSTVLPLERYRTSRDWATGFLPRDSPASKLTSALTFFSLQAQGTFM